MFEENKISNSNEIRRLPEESSIKQQCRICYDIERDSNILIHPCRCTGSVKYVHEECLKTWLLSTNVDLTNRACELCHTTFQMEYKVISYFSLREICDEALGSCMFIPILLSILALISVIIYFLAVKYESNDTGKDDKVYSLALMAGCAFAGGIILIILVYIIKSTFIRVKMEDWHIKNQDFSNENFEKPEEENVVMTHQEENNAVNLIPVTKVAKINGKKIRAPKVAPMSLAPVYEGEKLVGYKSEIKEQNLLSYAVPNNRSNMNDTKIICYKKNATF